MDMDLKNIFIVIKFFTVDMKSLFIFLKFFMIDMKNLLISISPQMYLMKIIVILLIFMDVTISVASCFSSSCGCLFRNHEFNFFKYIFRSFSHELYTLLICTEVNQCVDFLANRRLAIASFTIWSDIPPFILDSLATNKLGYKITGLQPFEEVLVLVFLCLFVSIWFS